MANNRWRSIAKDNWWAGIKLKPDKANVCHYCNHKLKTSSYYEEYRRLIERHEDCSNCGYSYSYVYGNFEQGIKGRCDFYWTYNTSLQKKKKIAKEFDQHMKEQLKELKTMRRKAYKKH